MGMCTRISLIFITFFIGLVVTGCGTKTISQAPEITYGNPDYKHMKDLPRVRYDPYADAEKKSKKEDDTPLSADEYEALGDAFLNQGNFFMAYTQYGKSLEKNPENIRALYKQGLTLLQDKKPGDAMPVFDQVLDREPDFAPAYEGLGRAHFALRNLRAAKIQFERAISLDPLLWRSFHFLGMIYDRNRDHDAAITAYRTALTLRPGEGMIYNSLGVSLSAAGRSPDAVDAFKQALSNGYTKDTVFNNLGNALCDLERYDEAFQAFQRAGGTAVAYNNTGVGYLKNGLPDQAAAYFRKAIEESPRFYVTAHENLQKALRQQ
jgi:tetratricopeptide (TPR) repeat protein